MKIIESIAGRKLEAIQDVFQQAFAIASETPLLASLSPKLDSFNIEFRSIAYEAASMSIALSALEKGEELSDWFEFLDGGAAPHAIQYHIGLGWALAQIQLDTPSYLLLLDPVERYRVLDGYGYYEAMFRTKKSIHNQQRPDGLNDAALSAYYQGIGRGMWYLTMGNIEDVQNMIEKFSAGRHADLWRGVGIACAYAGGCDETILKEIMALAGDYRRQLATGAVMVAICRQNAGFMSDDTELACKVWCKQSAEELASNHKLIAPIQKTNEKTGYIEWILGIESSF